MTDKLRQIVKEELGKLPKETQEAINSLDWARAVEEIGKKYLLLENGINDLQIETLLVLVGLEDVNDYAQRVENEVGMTKDEAEKIAEEVVNKIFSPISNAIEENIKKNLKSKSLSTEQNLNFILSGGNYSAFLESTATMNATETEGRTIPVFSIKEENLKGKFNI